MRLILKTVPGLEDLLVLEALNIGKASSYQVLNRGVLLSDVNDRRVHALLDQSRYLTSASAVLISGTIGDSIEDVKRVSDEVQWERAIPNHSTVAVRTERVGKHSFTSLDVNRCVGDSILTKTRSANLKVAVHLNSPNVVVSVDIIQDRIYVGIRLAGEESLHRKWYRMYEHPAALKPPIANALLELGDLRDGERLLDPVCGGGTIPIEALLHHEDIEAYCNDISSKSISMARVNARVAGVAGRIKFLNYDVEDLARLLPEKGIDLISANPPYGIRLGEIRESLKTLRKILQASSLLLSSRGRMSLIYPYREYVKDFASDYGLEIIHERNVLHGNLSTWIIVLS